jgi:hypothetical protein
LIAAQFLCSLTEGFHHIPRISFSYVCHLDANAIGKVKYHQFFSD